MSNQTRTDRYQILDSIARGAYGEVTLAIDRRYGRKVAIKSVKSYSRDEFVTKAIFREIESLRLLHSSYTVELYDTYAKGSQICLVLEYLSSDLSEVVSQASSYLPIGMIKAYAHMILKAVHHCHSHSIIHRDLKLSSMFTL